RVLDDGRAGVTFRNEDSEDLADRLIELLRDPERRSELHRAGYLRSAEFDWSSVARRVVEVYRSVAVGGEKVTADLSRQFWGKLPLRRPTWSGDEQEEGVSS
ncbi:MAG: glycosyltransferase, partial [Actinomycetota bacterium]|nr:glycosyltransferase [Actinomycetota bacterium]